LPPDLGSPNRTHVFVFDDIVVKIDQQDSNRITRERNALELLRRWSMQVPRFVADGVSSQGRKWLVMTRLPGTPPPDAARPGHESSVVIAAQLGTIAARLHNGPRPPGFGTWTVESTTMIEEYARRVQLLHSMGVDAAIVDRAELDGVVRLLDDTRAVLETAPSAPVLAHRDMQPRNVLVDAGGTITALLDYESAAGGDAAEDFNRVALDWQAPAFAPFVEGYRRGGGQMDGHFAHRVAHHVLFWSLAVFAYLGAFVPSMLPIARQAVLRVRAGEVPQL
jgi:aminoglycoside phosphotransferase (APT) family kinase protein